MEYMLVKENFVISDSAAKQFHDGDLLKRIKSMLFQFKGDGKILIPRKKKTNDLAYLSKFKRSLLFYIHNQDELVYLTPVLHNLNRSVIVFCNFSFKDYTLPEWVHIFELKFCVQKNYCNDMLEKHFNELFNYLNTFITLISAIEPDGIVVRGDSGFQGRALSCIGRNNQIPIVDLKYGNNNHFISDFNYSDQNYYIELELTNSVEESLDNISSQIARFINRHTPFYYFKQVKEAKLHIGAGSCSLFGWLNVDLNPTDKVAFMNAENDFPFPNNSFDYVFSEHLFEHLSYQGGKNMLYETYRVLKPDGIMRLTMPELRFLIELYLNKDSKLHEQYIEWSTSTFTPEIKNDFGTDKIPPMFVINNFMRFWGHKMIYDKETVTYLLKNVGFKNIVYPIIGESNHYIFKGIEQHGKMIPDWANRLESLVVEAQK